MTLREGLRSITKKPQYFKATRPNGYDFHTGSILYEVGKIVRPHKISYAPKICEAGYLHASSEKGEVLVGGSWPCKLFVVEGKPYAGFDGNHPYKGGFKQLKVIKELPAWQALGPNGKEVAAHIERCKKLSKEEIEKCYQVGGAAWGAAWDAARGAALALTTRDLISQKHFDILTRVWREAVGVTWPTK